MVKVTQADIDFAHELAFMGFATIHDYEMHVRKMAAAHHEAGRRAGLEEAAGVARKIGQCSNATGRADCCEHTAEDIEGAIRAKIGDDNG